MKLTTKQKVILAFFGLNFGLFIYNAFYEWYENKKILAVVFAIVFFVFELILVKLYFFLENKKKWKIEKIFLIIALVLGVFHIFITPFNQLPDEIVHIFRTYDIADGNFVSKKNEEGVYYNKISKSAYKLLNNAQIDRRYYGKVVKQIFEPTSGEKWGYRFDSAAIYTPISYAPQTTGVVTGKILHLPAAMTMYLGRIFALVAYAVIIYFAIKLTPKFKEFFALFGLLPMALQQGMAYSPDSMSIALGFLLVALALKAIYGDNEKLSKKFIVAIYVTVITLALSKSLGYLPMALILVLIPAAKFGKKWYKYLHLALLAIIPYILNMIWQKIQDHTVVATVTDSATVAAAAPKVISFVDYIVMSIGSFFGSRSWYYADGILGRNLSYSNFEAPIQVYVILLIALVTVMVIRTNEKIKIRKFDKLIYWAVPIFIVMAFYYVAALGWKHIGDNNDSSIIGIQGRYYIYIPLLPLIPLLAYYDKKKTEPLHVDYIFLFAIFANFAVLGSKFLHNF